MTKFHLINPLIHLICLTFVLVFGIQDPLIYDVVQLTKNGTHSFPVFNRNNRSILFSAFGPNYGTKCPHVYELDLMNYNKWPASLFSTGIGHESQPFDFLSSDVYQITSTTCQALKQFNVGNRFESKGIEGTYQNNDFFCPQSQCENPSKDLKEACSKPHAERFNYQSLTLINHETGVVKMMYFLNKTQTQWESQHIELTYAEIYAKNCNNDADDSSNTNGECIVYMDYSSEFESTTKIVNGTFDGFNRQKYFNGHENDFYYHGQDLTNDQKRMDWVKKGISPFDGSKVYYTDYSNLIHGNDPVMCHSATDPISYIYPRAELNMKFVLATGIDPNAGKKAIYQLEKDKNPILISNLGVNSFHASLDSTGEHIVFVSDRDGSEQLYMGKFKNPKAKNLVFKTIKPKTITIEGQKAIGNATAFTKQYMNKVMYPRINSNGVLMFTAAEQFNDCHQIYQIDPKFNDLMVKRKISTGIHHHSSPNFLPNGDILFASTLTMNIDDPLELKCEIKKCLNTTFRGVELKQVCENVVEEFPVLSESELYISNEYGSLKERLTANDVYDGEAVLSPDAKKLLFSRFDNGDYDLFEMDLGDRASIRRITNTLGFEHSPTYSPDGKLIAYSATRPDNSKDKDMYRKRFAYGFVDVSLSSVFIYSMETSLEYDLRIAADYMYRVSPMFLDNERLVFVGCDEEKFCVLYGIQLIRENKNVYINNTFVIENNWPYTDSIYIQQQKEMFKMAFVKNEQFTYALYLTDSFNPSFSQRNVVEPSMECKKSLSDVSILFVIFLMYFR